MDGCAVAAADILTHSLPNERTNECFAAYNYAYGGAEVVEPGPAVVVVAEEATAQEVEGREGLDHMQKVLDDGYEKQDMVKWRDAEVMENDPASADEGESQGLPFIGLHKGE